jgi:predicted ferric reductase
VLALYLMVLVTVTFYLRGRIGMKAFRVIHTLSLVSYLGITAHSIFSGTDSSLTSVMLLYVGTFLITLFLLFYCVFTVIQKNRQKSISARAAASPAAQTLSHQKIYYK